MTYPNSTRHGGSLALGGDCDKSSGACYWFTNNQPIPGLPVLNDAWIRSVNVNESNTALDWSKANPWRAPGTAPVLGSGCGIAGGGPVIYANGGTPPRGIEQGVDGITLPKKTATIWPRGSIQEVGMAVSANHAGGYSWRLCKDDGNVSEACFQQNQLRFAGSKQWIYYASQEWSEIPLTKVSQGTYPEGSEWARFPVPSCVQCHPESACGTPLKPMPGGDYGSAWNQQVNCNGACHGSSSSKRTGSCPAGSQFPEPLRGMSGFGKSVWEWSVVDQVVVPDNLEPGDYLLSWRWDCEQSDQVFQNCADIKITVDQNGGAERIRMDPSKKINVYKGSGTVKCDGLYEDCNSTSKSYSTVCQELDVGGCPTDAKCEVVTKLGKEYCWLKGKSESADPDMQAYGAVCQKLAVSGCSKNAQCEVISKLGEKYCWVKQRKVESSDEGKNSAGMTCSKHGVSECSQHAECVVMSASGKTYCSMKEVKPMTVQNTSTGKSGGKDMSSSSTTCYSYGVGSCSQHAGCTIVSKSGKTYCWSKEMSESSKPEPEPEPAPASKADQSSWGSGMSAAMNCALPTLFLVMFVLPL